MEKQSCQCQKPLLVSDAAIILETLPTELILVDSGYTSVLYL